MQFIVPIYQKERDFFISHPILALFRLTLDLVRMGVYWMGMGLGCLAWLVWLHLGVDSSIKFELGVLNVATNAVVSPLMLKMRELKATFTRDGVFCGVTGTGREVELRVIEKDSVGVGGVMVITGGSILMMEFDIVREVDVIFVGWDTVGVVKREPVRMGAEGEKEVDDWEADGVDGWETDKVDDWEIDGVDE